jgi:hypothetical protein
MYGLKILVSVEVINVHYLERLNKIQNSHIWCSCHDLNTVSTNVSQERLDRET